MERFTIASYAVVLNEDEEILLCRRRGEDMWVLPGGSAEEAEPPWQAVLRELKEETGVEADLAGLVGIYFKIDEDDLVFVFRCRPQGGRLAPSDETDRVGYFPSTDLPPTTTDRHRDRIEDAIGAGDRPVLRAHRSPHERPPAGSR